MCPLSEVPLYIIQDEDVISERKKIASGDTDKDDAVIIKDLVKVN